MKVREQEALLAKQFKFLRQIKQMKIQALRNLHNEVFAGSRYSQKIPKWVHRSHLERRLFYAFCIRNYHYPKAHPTRVAFFRLARRELKRKLVNDAESDTKQRFKNQELYTEANINAMPINEVDRALSVIGIYADTTQKNRRRMLYEWFHLPVKDLVPVLDDQGNEIASRKVGRLNNQYSLRRIILEYPTMDFQTFRLQFGNAMPTVSRASFHNTRTALRKAGYNIPKVSAGCVIKRRNGKLTIGNAPIQEFDDTFLQREKNHG